MGKSQEMVCPPSTATPEDYNRLFSERPFGCFARKVPAARFLLVAVILSAVCLKEAVAQPVAGATPTTYELIINGESFRVESNRVVKLQSKKKPGVSYEIAIRIAPVQRLRLNAVQFDYDRLARVDDDRKPKRRTVRLAHELGVEMLISDWGSQTDAAQRAEILKTLTDSVTETLGQRKFKDLKTAGPHDRKFSGTAGRAMVVTYSDEQGLGHTCQVYVLKGPEFTVSCLVQYLDSDLNEVKDIVKKTLDSFRPVE